MYLFAIAGTIPPPGTQTPSKAALAVTLRHFGRHELHESLSNCANESVYSSINHSELIGYGVNCLAHQTQQQKIGEVKRLLDGNGITFSGKSAG